MIPLRVSFRPGVLLCLAAGFVLQLAVGDRAIELVGTTSFRVSIAVGEIVAVAVGFLLVVLCVPALPNLDAGRSRARAMALLRSLVVVVSVAGLALLSAASLTRRYRLPDGSGIPESELVVSNALFIVALALAVVAVLGRGWGILVATAGWVSGYAVILVSQAENPWPIDTFQSDGPWFSIPHIGATVTVVLIAMIIQYLTAGIGVLARRGRV